MPRRKRHFIYCKKGLHLLSQYGVFKTTSKRKRFQKKHYGTRECLICRQEYHRQRYLERKQKRKEELMGGR